MSTTFTDRTVDEVSNNEINEINEPLKKTYYSMNEINEPLQKTYYSDVVGTQIVDAITGEKYNYRVGSKNEQKLFKVRSTISYNNKYSKTAYPTGPSSTNQAFYLNPQVYMKHNSVVLSQDILDKWNERQQIM
jgi:hypothetical protein